MDQGITRNDFALVEGRDRVLYIDHDTHAIELRPDNPESKAVGYFRIYGEDVSLELEECVALRDALTIIIDEARSR